MITLRIQTGGGFPVFGIEIDFELYLSGTEISCGIKLKD